MCAEHRMANPLRKNLMTIKLKKTLMDMYQLKGIAHAHSITDKGSVDVIASDPIIHTGACPIHNCTI